MRFDLGSALVFDGEEPLGMIEFGDRGDSLWSAMAEVLAGDAQLAGPRPTAAVTSVTVAQRAGTIPKHSVLSVWVVSLDPGGSVLQ